MKIIRNGVVYLQKYDIAAIFQLSNFPVSIMDEIFSAQGSTFFIYNAEKDGLEFAESKFMNKANVRWIREQGWILNWDELTRLTPTELDQCYLERRGALDGKIDKFNQAPDDYRKKNWDDFSATVTKENHIVDSYGLMLEYVRGEKYFALPAGIAEYPYLSLRARLVRLIHLFH